MTQSKSFSNHIEWTHHALYTARTPCCYNPHGRPRSKGLLLPPFCRSEHLSSAMLRNLPEVKPTVTIWAQFELKAPCATSCFLLCGVCELSAFPFSFHPASHCSPPQLWEALGATLSSHGALALTGRICPICKEPHLCKLSGELWREHPFVCSLSKVVGA